MNGFKTTLITCHHCQRRIMIRPADQERGQIICSHVGCGAVNSLRNDFQYDERIVDGLPSLGMLTYVTQPDTHYPLRFGPNVIGTGDSCTVCIDRFMHGGRCFISRRHCTLTVTFDTWTGQLRYQLQDGALDPITQTQQYSLNGTLLNGTALQKTEIIDVGNGQIITLGRTDDFRLTHYILPPAMLETYKVDQTFNPDRTQ